MVHKLVHADHAGVNLEMGAVIHVQFNHHIAGGQIQLLATDILKIVSNTGLAELGEDEAVFIVIDAKAHIGHHQGNTHQYQNAAAAHQRPLGIVDAHEHSCHTQGKHDGTDGAVTLAEPDRFTGLVLHRAPEQLGETLVHQITQQEHTCYN